MCFTSSVWNHFCEKQKAADRRPFSTNNSRRIVTVTRRADESRILLEYYRSVWTRFLPRNAYENPSECTRVKIRVFFFFIYDVKTSQRFLYAELNRRRFDSALGNIMFMFLCSYFLNENRRQTCFATRVFLPPSPTVNEKHYHCFVFTYLTCHTYRKKK